MKKSLKFQDFLFQDQDFDFRPRGTLKPRLLEDIIALYQMNGVSHIIQQQ